MLHGERRTVKVVIYRHSQDIRTQLKQPNTTTKAEYNKSSLSISPKKKVDFEVFTSDRGIPPNQISTAAPSHPPISRQGMDKVSPKQLLLPSCGLQKSTTTHKNSASALCVTFLGQIPWCSISRALLRKKIELVMHHVGLSCITWAWHASRGLVRYPSSRSMSLGRGP